MMRLILLLLLLCPAMFVNGQSKVIQAKRYYPEDAAEFTKKTSHSYNELGGYEAAKFGETTMIIRAVTNYGTFYFVFKKKNKDNDEPINRNLYAFILVEDHAGVLEKVRFQDFGNPLYWPAFDYDNCLVEDADQDGIPEFYLSYMGESDGLDAKPYKQIVYFFGSAVPKAGVVKAKATAYYPAGNEEDVYTVAFDSAWQSMAPAVKERSKAILNAHKKAYGETFF
ncbi:hypothetical protein [Sphingobacterium paludis]|uniref:Uncharacterized protein n=1 Tax=Sphingobacterium paludis TaxID=1476465 RepID=A0A4R7DER4_9SPHI|nr:hypothetical protein [Sphingobacterium paludis]TDS17676.1 hypothetical protein B0I21_101547 [Sphingobacterium paludis]